MKVYLVLTISGHNIKYIIQYNYDCTMHMQYVFDYQPGDIFGCVAVLGWITGHSYVVYGPLCNGGTTVLFESIATYPDHGTLMYSQCMII